MPPHRKRGLGSAIATKASHNQVEKKLPPNTICVSEFLNGDPWQTMPSGSARRPSFASSIASTATTKPSTAERNIDNVVLGDILFRAWYPSYHVKEIVGKEVVDGKTQMLERLYVCNHCFKYSKELVGWMGHLKSCERRLGGGMNMVPGTQIYTHESGTWSVWEVDGEVDTVCSPDLMFQEVLADGRNSALLSKPLSLCKALSRQQISLFRCHRLQLLLARSHKYGYRGTTCYWFLQ